jgi:hypothetical protein
VRYRAANILPHGTPRAFFCLPLGGRCFCLETGGVPPVPFRCSKWHTPTAFAWRPGGVPPVPFRCSKWHTPTYIQCGYGRRARKRSSRAIGWAMRRCTGDRFSPASAEWHTRVAQWHSGTPKWHTPERWFGGRDGPSGRTVAAQKLSQWSGVISVTGHTRRLPAAAPYNGRCGAAWS